MHASSNQPRVDHDWRCNQPTPEPTTIRDSGTGAILEVLRCWQCGAWCEAEPTTGGDAA